MLTFAARSTKEAFALAATAKRQDLAARDKAERFEARERDRERREERRAEDGQDAADMAMIEIVLATPDEIVAFDVRLDDYDTATVEALMDNGEALDRVRQAIGLMRAEAHVLPDGRRVFETTDGSRVFDETGAEVSREIVTPDIIDDAKPKWESYRDAVEISDRLLKERQDLLDFQAKVDDARVAAADEDIAKDELDALGDGLDDAMPQAVRAKLALEAPEPKQDVGPTLDDRDSVIPAGHALDDLARGMAAPQPGPA